MTREKRAFRSIIHAQHFASRSSCWVMAGAAIVDKDDFTICGGWNHAGPDGMGQHAEAHALLRLRRRVCNLPRPPYGIVIAKSNGKKWLTSPPCAGCRRLIQAAGLPFVRYFNGSEWVLEEA